MVHTCNKINYELCIFCMYKTYSKILSYKFFLNDNVLSWLRTELAYTSNHIEGNTLTRHETALAIEEGLSSGSKPIKHFIEAQNHAKAFDYIVSLQKAKIASYEDVILRIHELILNGINDEYKRRYRNVSARIAGTNAVLPNPLKVPDLMNDFCRILDNKEDSILKAIEAHYKLVEIHPFIDGNGRTARLIMALILLHINVVPLTIRPIERKRYLNSINKRNVSGNIIQYYEYMLKQLLNSAEIFGSLFGEQNYDQKDLLNISEFANICGVPISTIRYYLRTNKINPICRTESGYMLFSKNQVYEVAKDV